MKIQYPDVAAGIQSDTENLVGVIEYIFRRNVRCQYCGSYQATVILEVDHILQAECSITCNLCDKFCK